MKSPEIAELLVAESKSIREAIECIDRSAQGICFAVNERGKLVGALTDGDIRRALLKGAELSSPLSTWMMQKCFSLPVTAHPELIQKSLSHRITHIPLLDTEGCPVDYASFHRFRKLQVMEPTLSGNELLYVSDCIKTKWISSQGAYVSRFEKMFAEYCGVERALAVSNGTVALHLALVALGIGEGDEVIVPDFTFAASINAVLHAGATPVIVDIDPETWNMSAKTARAALSPRTKAIMPVHLYGQPCDLDPLLELAREKNLLVIEDCAEAIGSRYKGKMLGSFGDAATFSFFGNKTITTGEGGMVFLKDPQVFERANRLRDHGMSRAKRYWHEEVGYNYRLTNIQAAIGVAQMERIDEIVERKKNLGKLYQAALSDVTGVKLPSLIKDSDNSYWLFTLLIEKEFGVSRNDLIDKLLMRGIETRPVFYPLHEMPIYKPYAQNREFPTTTSVSEAGISLPSAVDLSMEDLNQVCSSIKSIGSIGAFRSRSGNLAARHERDQNEIPASASL